MAKVKELSFKISKLNTDNLINTLKDLSSIDKKVLFRIDKDNTLIYSKVGIGDSINAFKSFIFKTDDLFNVKNLDDIINFISNDAKEFYRKLQILNSFDEEISGKFHYDLLGDIFFTERISLKAGNKLKLNFTGGDPLSINSKISVEAVKNLMNVDNASFSFSFKSDDFTNIKRLSTNDTDSDIFFMNTIEKDGKNYVTIGESMWDLNLSEINYEDLVTLSFPKKYFKSITIDGDSCMIYVFDNMIMISNGNSDMLISTEVSA